MIGPIARILLRYAAGGLVAAGLLGADEAEALIFDPDVNEALVIGLGVALAFATELAYSAARRLGWAT